MTTPARPRPLPATRRQPHVQAGRAYGTTPRPTTAQVGRQVTSSYAAAQRRQARQQQRGGRGSALRTARRAIGTRPASTTNYQGVILAEFVAAIVLVATAPIATNKNKQGLSPYRAQDVLQLAAITFTFFLLALLSMTSRGAGRLGAWFGGLILLAVALAQAASIAKTLDLFGAGPQPGIEAGGQPLLPLINKSPGQGGIGNLPGAAGGTEAGGGSLAGGGIEAGGGPVLGG